MKFDNRTYDILKWVTMIVLPATGAFYFALSQIWGLPLGEEIVGTIACVTTFLGAILGISNSNYKTLEEENANAPELDDPFGDYSVTEEGDSDANG